MRLLAKPDRLTTDAVSALLVRDVTDSTSGLRVSTLFWFET